MDQTKELEERLREAACIGDMDSLQKLLESQGVNVNAQNGINGWTALHWGSKRNHVAVVAYLIQHGADKNIVSVGGELAAQLTSNADILGLLGVADAGISTKKTGLPITPSYLAHPQFPYLKDQGDGSVVGRVPGPSSPVVSNHVGTGDNELVLKARLAYCDEKDFIEVELDRNSLTFDSLLNLLCAELGVDKRLVYKIRKLPDTIVRKDKDVKRLVNFQAVELVLTNKAISASSRGYGFTSGMKNEQILY